MRMKFPLSPDAHLTLSVGVATGPTVLAVGADLKNTVCLLQTGSARVSRSHGALSDPEGYRAFLDCVESWNSAANGAVILAHDVHPAYASTLWAQRQPLPRVAVQHHHAHLAANLAEHGVDEVVVGIVCDGTGWGDDGAIWGGEILVGSRAGFERWGHLEYFPLPGGDAAARQTWRPALSLVEQAFAGNVPAEINRLFERVDAGQLRIARRMLRGTLNAPPTSSLGRVFDAVAFLVGCCDANDTEGLAPLRLEELGYGLEGEPYTFSAVQGDSGQILVVREAIREICLDLAHGVDAGTVSGRFHATLSAMFTDAASSAAKAKGLNSVVLSGGCMLNRILVDGLRTALERRGIGRVLAHHHLSPGDSGLSVGQAVVAGARPAS